MTLMGREDRYLTHTGGLNRKCQYSTILLHFAPNLCRHDNDHDLHDHDHDVTIMVMTVIITTIMMIMMIMTMIMIMIPIDQ